MQRLPRDLLLVAPVVGIGALGLVEALLVDLGSDMHGSSWANACFVLGCVIPLLWRRSHPLAVLVVVFAVGFAWADLMYLDYRQAPFEPFVAGLVALFAAAQQLDDVKQSRMVLAVVALGFVVGDLPALILGRDAGDVLPAYVFLAGTWVVGRALRSRQRDARTQSIRAELAESERDRRVADERARIARELHDVITHSVSAIVVHAAAERRALAGERPQTQEAFALIERSGREALSELRLLLGVLRKREAEDLLTPQPGLASLDALIEQVRAAGLDVDLAVEGERRTLPAGVDLSAYRIVQEALTNVRKHAGGAGAHVIVRYGPHDVVLEVADEGGVLEPRPANGDGHGLIGMRERVSIFNGQLEARPLPHGGFVVRATLPTDSV
ncbi:MAG: hypothetical protein QOJ89_3761 [bacterium]|jgi:signal transduction histidine kinase